MIQVTAVIEIKYTYNGAELAAERERLGMSQYDLSRATGIIQQHISQYERPGPITIREHTKQAFEKAGIKFERIPMD